MFEGVRVDTVVSRVHHVVVSFWHTKAWVSICSQFESLIAAAGSNDCIRGSYSRNDVLDHTLGHGISDSLDIVLQGTAKRFLIEPSDVLWIVSVQRVACEKLVYELPASLKLPYPFALRPT